MPGSRRKARVRCGSRTKLYLCIIMHIVVIEGGGLICSPIRRPPLLELLSICSCYVCIVIIFVIKHGCFNDLGESVMQCKMASLSCELRELVSL